MMAIDDIWNRLNARLQDSFLEGRDCLAVVIQHNFIREYIYSQ